MDTVNAWYEPRRALAPAPSYPVRRMGFEAWVSTSSAGGTLDEKQLVANLQQLLGQPNGANPKEQRLYYERLLEVLQWLLSRDVLAGVGEFFRSVDAPPDASEELRKSFEALKEQIERRTSSGGTGG